MLYLEDFLEVVEGIPTEVKAKTSEIRDLDLSIHSNSEDLEEQIRTFFSNAKKMKSGERASTFEKIRRQYYKLLEDADEKVGIASNLHDSLERYVRRIDVEIEKFKCELEADSPGITEVLERKSLEMDEPSKEINQKDVLRTSSYHPRNQGLSSFFGVPDWRQSFLVKKDDSNDPNLSSHLSLSPTSSSLSYGHIGGAGGSNAIAAAASQAIAATQQMRHGRRTASLAASYDAVTHGAADFCIGSELASAAKAALAASSLMQDPSPTSLSWAMSDAAAAATAAAPISVSGVAAPSSREVSSFIQSGSVGPHQQSNKRQKKNSNLLPKDSSVEDIPQDAVIDPFMESPDWTYDPNEPRYCVCNQVSYGNMVACDNRKCPLEWFHYACVGITAPPKGKWFCPQCSTSINRRQRK